MLPLLSSELSQLEYHQMISEQQIAQFEQQLFSQLELLKQSISEQLANSEKSGQQVAAKQILSYTAEQIVEFSDKIALPEIDEQLDMLKKVDAAINNINFGIYGLCSDCEEPIETDRLNADATVQRCAHCEAKYLKQTGHCYKL